LDLAKATYGVVECGMAQLITKLRLPILFLSGRADEIVPAHMMTQVAHCAATVAYIYIKPPASTGYDAHAAVNSQCFVAGCAAPQGRGP
jgi:hypothetical protein